MALTIDELNIQIAADSSKASRALTSLINKLDKLKTSLSGTNVSNITITNSFNKVTNSTNKATTATNKYNNSTKQGSKTTRSFSDSLAYNITKFRTLFGVFRSLANVMGEWFNESNDYIETLNLFNVTMGDAADSAKAYAESVQELMGIDAAEWMQNQGVFKNLVSGFGVASEKADVMSQNLTQLSYDMASFFNTDVETAFDKLSSAMAGQVKGLREFGIDTTVATLQEYALARGIDAKVSKMTQAEKSMLRYNYIMEKSIIMQGDMARTLVTPANALRILSAQFTQLKRALGNIISVVVTQFIPYIQALVKVATDAAKALANLFGFELPEIDYSSLDSSFGEDLEEDLEGASSEAKKLKKQLMGFDELNIISDPNKDSGAGSGASSGVLDMEPLEYDFLKGLDTSKVDEIYNKVKKFLSPLKKIWNYLDDYEDTIKTIGGIIAGLAIVKGLKKVGVALAGLGLVSYFVEGFTVARSVGVGFFKSIGEGIDNVRYNMTGWQKALTVAIAGLIEFVAIKDSVKALALGCEDVGAKITTIGVVAGAAALAMYTALGPAGLVVAAVVGLAGAIVGVKEANEVMMEQMVSDVFYAEVGTKITVLADHFKTFADKIIETNQPILDNKATIDEAQKSIVGASESIEGLIISYERGLMPAEEFANNISTQFTKIRDDVKVVMDTTYDNVVRALGTSLGDAVVKAGGAVDEYMKIIGKIKEDGDTLYSALAQQQEDLSVKFANGTITADEYATGLRDINDKMAALAGTSTIVSTFSDKINGVKDSLNWEGDESARKDVIATINDSATEAKASVNEACDEVKRNLETMKAWTTDENALLAIDELLIGNEESRKQQITEINTAVNEVYDTMQNDVLNKLAEVTTKAQDEWAAMDGWARFLQGGNEAEYVSKAMAEYKKSFADPISEEIQGSMDRLGTEGTVWLSESVTKIWRSGFEQGFNGVGAYVSGYSESFEKDMKALGEDAALGYRDGVNSKIPEVLPSFETMAEKAKGTVAETQDSHSPAKEYIALAKDAMDGYALGVKENFTPIEKAFIDGFNNVFEKVKKTVSEALKAVSDVTNNFSVTGFTKALDGITDKAKSVFSATTWAGYVKNITNALDDIKMPTFKNIGLNVTFDSWVSADKKKVYEALGLSGFPKLNWYTYAQGGFPSVGEMFIAREAGPELVGSIGRKTAVANNDQIISGIESGVYRAVMAANSTNRGGSQTIRIINEIDGDVVGEKVIQYHNGKVMQTGTSPLLV